MVGAVETVLEEFSLACLALGWKVLNDRSAQSSCLGLLGALFTCGYRLTALGPSL